MKKLTRKTLVTILSLALIIVILGTTTFAWITISNRASVSGMEFDVKVPNGLQIEKGEEIVEKNFTNKINESGEDNIVYLQPVSSVDGNVFYYTPNLLSGVDGNGQLNASAKIYEYNDESFALLYDGLYDVTVQGYAEYTYILKATATESDLSVYLNDIDFSYSDGSNSFNAFRVAVLVKEYDSETNEFGSYKSLGLITSDNAEYNTKNAAIKNSTGSTSISYLADGAEDEVLYNLKLSNYGYVLYELDGKLYRELGDEEEYTLLEGGASLATSANRYLLQKAEYVLGVSRTQHENGKYEFKTNLGRTVYGDDPESVENTNFYESDGVTVVTLDGVAESILGDGEETHTSTVSRQDINGNTYYAFETNKGKTVYCKSDTANDSSTFYKLEFTDEELETEDPKTYLDRVTYFDPSQALLEVEEGKVGYVLVTFRIFVEGEDKNCTSAQFVALNSDYTMNVGFGFDEPTDLSLTKND